MLPDQRVRGFVVAVEIIVPADRRGIDEALHQVGLLLHHLAARLDQGRVAVEAVIGDQEDLRLELSFLLDREGLRRHIALHRALLVDQERRRIEGVGLHLVLREAELGLHPFEIGLQPFGRDEQRQLLQVLELLRLSGMRHQHLRLLLEHGCDGDGRNVLRDRVEALQRIRAHEEIDLAGEQRDAVVHLRAARHDGHVEAVFRIGAVGDRLIETAMLGLGHPVGAERDLVELLRLRGQAKQSDGEQRARERCERHAGAPEG